MRAIPGLIGLTVIGALLVFASSALALGASCTLSRTSVIYGQSVTVSGQTDVAAEDTSVSIAVDGVEVGTASTDATGAYTWTFTPRMGGAVTATVSPDATSDPVALVVRPAVRLSHGTSLPFRRTRFTLEITPVGYVGRVTAHVWHRGSEIASVSRSSSDGRAVLLVPLRGIEGFSVRFALEASEGLGSRRVSHHVNVPWRRLAVGSRGPLVNCLLRRFAALAIHVPNTGYSFSRAVADSTVAFQKTFRLPRTYAVGYRDWRRLETASRPRPKYSSPATHLEIHKARQILTVVRDGRVLGIVPVSTGATGNTPTGSFWIQRKLYINPDPVVMTRFMYFHKTMGIHGYPSVPPYPASHGCVREPLWAADWVYDRSFVGERLYIY